MINKKGVSLIELLAVIVIMGIIATIAIPVIGGLLDRAKDNANEANIIALNEATRLYELGENISGIDIFDGIESNSERITILFSLGYLDRLAQPLAPYPEYVWDILKQTWVLGDPINLDLPAITSYPFDTVRLTDMISYGSSIVVGSFTDSGDFIQSGGGLMYIPNPKETYTITLDAQILSSSTYGGFGVMFDSTASNLTTQSDTGWIVQVDRGYSGGEIIIRPRLNGSEQSPVKRFGIRFDEFGELTLVGGLKDNTNTWWSNRHTLKVDVSIIDANANQKLVSVYIDDIFLFDYEFVSTLFDDSALSNITGFRTWNGIQVAFYELNIS